MCVRVCLCVFGVYVWVCVCMESVLTLSGGNNQEMELVTQVSVCVFVGVMCRFAILRVCV